MHEYMPEDTSSTESQKDFRACASVRPRPAPVQGSLTAYRRKFKHVSAFPDRESCGQERDSFTTRIIGRVEPYRFAEREDNDRRRRIFRPVVNTKNTTWLPCPRANESSENQSHDWQSWCSDFSGGRDRMASSGSENGSSRSGRPRRRFTIDSPLSRTEDERIAVRPPSSRNSHYSISENGYSSSGRDSHAAP
jgi:hypothetical protein